MVLIDSVTMTTITMTIRFLLRLLSLVPYSCDRFFIRVISAILHITMVITTTEYRVFGVRAGGLVFRVRV